MGHGKGGATHEDMAGGGMSTRGLDQLSQQWLAGMSPEERAALQKYMQGNVEAVDQSKMESLLNKAPSSEKSFQVYMPVNDKTMPFLKSVVAGQFGGSPQAFHLRKSTALESSSATNRVMRFTVQKGTNIGAVTHMGGKGLRSPKVYIHGTSVQRTGLTKENGVTIYEFNLKG